MSRLGSFCCAGCRAVYSLLQHQGLGDFYKYKDNKSVEKPRTDTQFDYMDDRAFQEQYCPSPQVMRFYVPGLDCTACVWLIDQIPSHSNAIQSVRTDFYNSSVEVRIREGAKFSEAAKTLESFGLNPAPIQSLTQAQVHSEKESRTSLSRIAVAALGSGNIMLLSISIYAGVEGTVKEIFEWLMFALALPVLTYSAFPFYRNSFAWLRARKIHLDLPISMAIWAGALVSVYHLLEEGSELYFDSLSMLVFLLLSSRHLLKSLQSQHSGRLPVTDYLFAVQAKTVDGKIVSSLRLQPKDLFRLGAGEAVPTDAVITAGTAWIDNSTLTGESQAQKAGTGDLIYAGTRLLEGDITAEVVKSIREARVTRLLESVDYEQNSKGELKGQIDYWAQRFLYTVLFLSLATILYFWSIGNIETGIYRALTIMIVTCPCVFAMAIPWTHNLAIRAASKFGILIKDSEVFERILKSEELIFDKTGTLTQGFMDVKQWQVHNPHPGLEKIALSLEKHSDHPVAKAICRYFETRNILNTIQLEEVRLIESGGVLGKYKNHTWQIVPISDSSRLTVGLFQDDRLAASFILEDSIRKDSEAAIADLHKSISKITMLSGDQPAEALRVGQGLGLEEIYWGQTPESKLNYVKSHPKSIMVGDGNNDGPALKASFISIAVQGSLEASLKAADVYLTRPGLRPIVQLFRLSNHTMRVIRHNLMFTLVYNLIGLSLAVTGDITALWAAVLMPLSSLTVTLHSLFRMRKVLK